MIPSTFITKAWSAASSVITTTATAAAVSSSQKPLQHRHTIQKIVKTCPQHLYNIVTDVDSYRDFLPFCKSSRILRRSNCGTMFDASLRIGVSDIPPLNGMEEEYVSRVRHIVRPLSDDRTAANGGSDDSRKEWIVEAKSIKSHLFHSLNSCWKLTPIEYNPKEEVHDENNPQRYHYHQGQEVQRAQDSMASVHHTHVEFEVDIRVTDPFLSMALSQVLESVALQQMQAFEQRCKAVPFHDGYNHSEQ